MSLKMKSMSLLLFAVLITSCQVEKSNQKEKPITKEEIKIAQDLIQGAFDDLWGGVDSTKISKYHTKDFIILEQGEIWDNDRIKEYMKSQLARPNRAKRINKMDYISIEKFGNSIQIAYFNEADFTRADTLVGKAKWLESAVAVKTEIGWRLKMMHSTGVRD
ncbi:hypothetical protein SAMN04489761_1215 [Tenacibaculum sp. MAR_2009_124]|nr:hypothetical protein SAMN04489761_1215 [Tenacibaculum sp. MAR_2009_124]